MIASTPAAIASDWVPSVEPSSTRITSTEPMPGMSRGTAPITAAISARTDFPLFSMCSSHPCRDEDRTRRSVAADARPRIGSAMWPPTFRCLERFGATSRVHDASVEGRSGLREAAAPYSVVTGPRYNAPVAAQEEKPLQNADVQALFERLKHEVERAGAGDGTLRS